MDIRCRKTTCLHNEKHTCMAKEINVSKNVICEKYERCEKEEIDTKKVDTSKTMFKKTPQNSPHRDRRTIKITCFTDCLFNDKGCCAANGITVNDLGEPYCMGYLKK